MELRHIRWGSTSPRWPNASNTGVSRGTPLTDSLTNSFNAGHNGMTIENKIFTGGVEVFGSNIVFRNCRFQGFGIWGLVQYTDPPHNSTDIRVERCTFDAEGAVHSSAMGIGGGANSAVVGCDISGVTLAIQSFGQQLIANNYIHDLYANSILPEDRHFDGITVFGGGNVIIENNAIVMPDPDGGTAAVFCACRSSDVVGVTVRNNLLLGNPSFAIFLEDSGGSVTGIGIENNYIEYGVYGTIGIDAAEAPVEIGNVEWNPSPPDFDPTPEIVTAWLATV